MRSQPLHAVLNDAVLHHGMVPVERSRSKDAIFEVKIVLSRLEHQRGMSAELAGIHADLANLEQELGSLGLPVGLERAEQLRRVASSLYECAIEG